jgi:dGTPase
VEAFLTIPPDDVLESLDERLIEESSPSTRSEAERDRDRILYSSAFLRLGHITQVAAPEIGHTFHSRLTHSMKVAQVARGLAQRQKSLADDGELDDAASRLVAHLDEDATEAASLAHDLGHPPFGHLAERVLQARSRAAFEGNPQSFRIVTQLAMRAIDAGGLNLTRRTLNGILKYPWLRAEDPPEHWDKWGAYDVDRAAFEWARQGYEPGERTLEAWLMDWADDVTYAVHDMDDFYRAGLIPLERLTSSESDELGRFKEHMQRRVEDSSKDDESVAHEVGRMMEATEKLFAGFFRLINKPFSGRGDERINLRQVGSALIGHYIKSLKLRDAEDGERVVIEIDDHTVDQVKALKELTWFYVINRPSLSVMQRGRTQIIETLFAMYRTAIEKNETHLFPPLFLERVEEAQGELHKERIVIDLIAGMTEASAAEIYRQRAGVADGSVLLPVAGPI